MDNDYDAIEEELYYNESYREFIAIRNNFYYMSDEEYEEIYSYDRSCRQSSSSRD